MIIILNMVQWLWHTEESENTFCLYDVLIDHTQVKQSFHRLKQASVIACYTQDTCPQRALISNIWHLIRSMRINSIKKCNFTKNNPQNMQTRLVTRLTMCWTKSLCDKHLNDSQAELQSLVSGPWAFWFFRICSCFFSGKARGACVHEVWTSDLARCKLWHSSNCWWPKSRRQKRRSCTIYSPERCRPQRRRWGWRMR